MRINTHGDKYRAPLAYSEFSLSMIVLNSMD